ncbi:MAG: HNH endonuclease [Planctomycetales bacterium]|nr:HNH endonuclease [Planctomycetales bacterium]MCA9164860.1 HNH endonuclease [Planctomycetales bacterium]
MTDVADSLRSFIIARANSRCEYCGVSSVGQIAPFEVDHVMPRTRGGTTIAENLSLACPRCNAFKWAHTTGIDPLTAEEIPLFDPRCQIWHEHFRWSESNLGEIVGVTACGRATINRLRMNASAIVVIRRLLLEAGLISAP